MSDLILVTGAGGYLGQGVVAQLHDRGSEVVALVRSRIDYGFPEGVRTVVADLADAEDVERIFRELQPGAVVHAAACITGGSDDEAVGLVLRNNVQATTNLVNAAVKVPLARFVFCSSVDVYGDVSTNSRSHRECDLPDPRNLYGHSKIVGESIARLLEGVGTQVVSVRMPGIHGGSRTSGVVARMIDCALRGETISVSEPGSVLSFLWQGDGARVLAILASREAALCEPVLNVANGNLSLGELADRISSLTDAGAEIERGNKPSRNRKLDVCLAGQDSDLEIPKFDDGLQQAVLSAKALMSKS